MRTALIVVCGLMLFTGCAATLPGSGGFTDATAPLGERHYTVVGPAQATVFSTIFLLQFGSPDIAQAKQAAIAEAGGDELIDVVWEVEHRNYLLFRKLGVTVRGTAIKFTEGDPSSGRTGGTGSMGLAYRPPPFQPPPKRDHGLTLALGGLSDTRPYWNPRTRRYKKKSS